MSAKRRITLVMAAVVTCMVAQPAAAMAAEDAVADAGTVEMAIPPHPDDDPFYGVPNDIAERRVGEVVRSRRIRAMPLGVPLPADAHQFAYRTIDQHGQPSAFVATVLVPFAAWQDDGPRPLLVYNAVEAGLSRRCTASYAFHAGLLAPPTSIARVESAAVALALSRGWAVLVPDYQGPGSEYLGMDGYSTSVLDAIRAARGFAPAGIDRAAPVGMMGYSGGALATIAAALAQPQHAPDINFAGIASGGTPVDLATTIGSFSGQPLGGALAVMLGGLARAHPELRTRQLLNEDGQAAVAASENDCLLDAAVRHPGASLDDWSRHPGLLERPAVARVLRGESPMTRDGTIQAPLLLYHVSQDQHSPEALVHALAARYCGDGTPVNVIVQTGLDHFTHAPVGGLQAMDYLADRFAGEPIPNSCQDAAGQQSPRANMPGDHPPDVGSDSLHGLPATGPGAPASAALVGLGAWAALTNRRVWPTPSSRARQSSGWLRRPTPALPQSSARTLAHPWVRPGARG